MTEKGTGEAAKSPRFAATLLVMVGGVMLASGLSGLGSGAVVAAYVGGTMLVWTVLLPRLSVFASLRVFFSSHALAAGAYWAALAWSDGDWILVGPYEEVVSARRLVLVYAVVASAAALALGLALERVVRRGGSGTRRVLGALAVGAAVLATASIVASRSSGARDGDAPRAIERVRFIPVAARIGAGQRVVRGPFPIVRSVDGSFQPVQPGNLDWIVSQGPGAIPAGHRGDRVCRWIPLDAAIEVRDLDGVLLFTAMGALDDRDALTIAGCAYDASSMEPVTIRASDLDRPIATDARLHAVSLAALAIALAHLLLAAYALARHALLGSAREGVSDGEGSVRLEDGSLVRCTARKGPVLVVVRAPETEHYRESAAAEGRLVAAGTRAEVEAAMHLETCSAFVGVIGAALAAALPLLAALLAGLVIPL